jgi:hypothetical protein
MRAIAPSRHVRLAAVTLVLCAPAAAAQQVIPSRFARGEAASVVPSLVEAGRIPDPILDLPRRAPFGRQAASGFVGGLAGSVLSAVVVALPASLVLATGEPASLETFELIVTAGAIVGATVGTTMAVRWYGRRHDVTAGFGRTILGASVGVLGGPFAPVTIPVGAVIGFNGGRRLYTGSD